jgi:hypothetical protein
MITNGAATSPTELTMFAERAAGGEAAGLRAADRGLIWRRRVAELHASGGCLFLPLLAAAVDDGRPA